MTIVTILPSLPTINIVINLQIIDNYLDELQHTINFINKLCFY